MIIRTIAVCGAFFLGWTFLILFNWSDGASQSQFEDNIIKAQKFIYDDPHGIQNVVVGSSLSCRLAWNDIPGFYDLSMNGLSLFDGLAILNSKKILPKTIFIETNMVLNSASESFYNTIFSPIPFFLKKHVITFRDGKQPLAILGDRFLLPLYNDLSSGVKKSFGEQEIKIERPEIPKQNAPVKSELVNESLKMTFDEYSQKPDSDKVENQFKLLHRDVVDLKAKGVAIVFIELPMNHTLENLPKAKIIREKFKEYFSKGDFRFIDLPANYAEYITLDGIHLTGRESRKYMAFFNSIIK
jgi:hypothetical protein